MNDFIILGCVLAIGAFSIVVITVLISWFSGWPLLLETWEDTLMLYSVPLLALAGSIISFAIAGIRKLWR